MKQESPKNRFKILVIAICFLIAALSFASEALSVTYTYDALKRLTSAQYENGQVLQYKYDSGGNILSAWAANDGETKITEKENKELTAFGYAVSISGDYAVVADSNGGGACECGASYVFKKEGSNWVQKAKLTLRSTALHSGSGNLSVSISGDYVIVGYPFYNWYYGAVYIFEKPVGGWTDMTETAQLFLSDGAKIEYFGTKVSISGDYAIVGANGSAYIFKRDSSGKWSQQAKLISNDFSEGDRFGFNVSIYGDYALVGANSDDNKGSAYIFKREGTTWIQKAKLVASDGTAEDYFGESVSLSEDYALIGAVNDDEKGRCAGSAYIFKREGENWIQQKKLYPNDIEMGDILGSSVSLAGDYALIGASQFGCGTLANGKAYIFKRQDNDWIQYKKLTASDGDIYDQFGGSVSISENYAIVGAHYNTAAYIYDLSTMTSDADDSDSDGIKDSWEIEQFGDLSHDGNTDTDGDWLTDFQEYQHNTNPTEIDTDNDGMPDGFEIQYDLNPLSDDASDDPDYDGYTNLQEYTNGTNPIFQDIQIVLNVTPVLQKVSATSDTTAFEITNTGEGTMQWTATENADWFSITPTSGANTETVTVTYDANIGFERTGIITVAAIGAKNSPTIVQVEQAGELSLNEVKITANDGQLGDSFGESVSISGDYAIIGTPYDDDNGSASGSAYIFKRDGEDWIQQQKLIPTDAAEGITFGRSVSISGDYAVIGAINGYNSSGIKTGVAYVFKREGATWIQKTKLSASDAEEGDNFGISISISSGYIIIGADKKDNDVKFFAGAAYIFKQTGESWIQKAKLTASDKETSKQFGYAVSISDKYAIVGAAYIFEKPSTEWYNMTETARLAPNDGGAEFGFGSSVSIYSDYAIIGNTSDDDNGTRSGSAYIFKREATGWVQKQKLVSSDGTANDLFGYAVSLFEDYAVVTAPQIGDVYDIKGPGAAYLFKREGENWVEQIKLTANDVPTDNQFGRSVSVYDKYIIVGATLNVSFPEIDQIGAAYIYKIFESDSDADGMKDSWETEYFGDLSHDGTADTDGDGLSDFQEYQNNTNPIGTDTDNDGMPDDFEIQYDLNPLENDASADADNDGYSNLQEYLSGSDPTVPNLVTVLSVTPSAQNISAESGTTTFEITNTGTGTMQWTATENSDWFSISPTSGTDSGTITVTYDGNNGVERTGTITITADGAENSPQTVKVKQDTPLNALPLLKLDEIQVPENTFAYVPLILSNPDEQPIEGLYIVISFDENIINATGTTLTGGVLENKNYELSQINTEAENTIAFVITGSTNLFTDSGIIAYLQINVLGNAGNTTPLTLIRGYVNDTPVYTDNGSIKVIQKTYTSIYPGDINNDTVVDIQDAILALKVLAGMTQDAVHADADVNGDDKIGMEEVIYILQHIAETR